MEMTTNEALARYNFIKAIKMKTESGELSKEMKVKVMGNRIALKKIQEAFDADTKEFADGIITDEFKALQSKQDKSEEEIKELTEQSEKINSEYAAYVQQRSKEEVEVNFKKFTEEEYYDLLAINDGNDVNINGQKISSEDFLEVLYSLFVEE